MGINHMHNLNQTYNRHFSTASHPSSLTDYKPGHEIAKHCALEVTIVAENRLNDLLTTKQFCFILTLSAKSTLEVMIIGEDLRLNDLLTNKTILFHLYVVSEVDP